MRHSSFLEVNLGLLGQNFELIQKLAPKAAILPMVKANAYGNGLVPVSQFLTRDFGVKFLGCASLGEAIHILDNFPSVPAQIIVFSDTEIHQDKVREIYLGGKVLPVLHHASDLEFVLNNADFKNLPLYIKVNTGMNRLGLTQSDLERFAPQLKKRGVRQLMTHFARSSNHLAEGDKTHKQYAEFQKMKKYLMDSGVEIAETSVANSGAIEQQFGTEETFVRPGLMLYGPPSVENPIIWKGHQISKLVTTVMTTFDVKKGTPVGYGVNVADKDSHFAVLPIGYGDGILTYYSGGKIRINGIEGKIFGRVNMDMTFVQFNPEDAGKISIGNKVEIWNHDNKTIAEFADQAKTHAYQLMCGISSRIPRIYKVK